MTRLSVHFVRLPRLAGSRAAASALVADAGNILGSVVIVDGRQLRSAPYSFAEAMVEAIVVEGGAQFMALKSTPPGFADDVREAGTRLNVAHKVAS